MMDFNMMMVDELIRDERTIKGYGRAQHGFNGKNADLDAEGQCVVKSLVIEDPVGAKDMRIAINLHLYADVCEPYLEPREGETEEDFEQRQSNAMDVATEIVCDTQAYSGEWTGSDYWCFSHDETLYVPLTVDEFDLLESKDQATIDSITDRVAKAILVGSEDMRDFEQTMSQLNKEINELSKEEESA
jgi:hypothetical protein